MNILWFSWKDIKHPEAGGAETISHKLMSRLVTKGHNVKLITADYKNAGKTPIDGVEVIRRGKRFTVYLKARQVFLKQYKNWPDIIVDEMNTLPFAVGIYTKKPVILLTYQLAREIWFYQMVFPFSLIGYLIEPIYLRLLSKKYSVALTESQSTKDDLVRYGFKQNAISIFRVSVSTEPLRSLNAKPSMNNILFLGAFRPMKRPIDAIKAFELAKDQNPALTLNMAGNNNSKYGQKVINYARSSRYSKDIQILGRVDDNERLRLMQESTLILVTSIKEGWGLIATEANSQGTIAVAYDTDGLRDSVLHEQTGILVKNGDTELMAKAIIDILSDPKMYHNLRKAAWEHSKQFNDHNLFDDFSKILFRQRPID